MTSTIKKILFTTDLSDGAMDVFKQAVRLAGSCDASIVMLHVMEETRTSVKNLIVDMLGEEAVEKLEEENRTFAENAMLGKQREAPIIQETLEKLAQHSESTGAEKSVPIDETLVVTGIISEEIVARAEKHACDIIVMGYHVRNIIGELMLGNKTKKVMRHSKIPVYLVPVHD